MPDRICTKCGLPNDTRMILLCRKCYRKEYAIKNKVKIRQYENKHRKTRPEYIQRTVKYHKEVYTKNPENRLKNKIRAQTRYFCKKKNKCDICGYEGNTQYHHYSYESYKCYKELCRICHLKEHKMYIEGSGATNEISPKREEKK